MSIDAMQQALEALEAINEMSKPPMNIPLAAEIDGAMDALRKAIREAALDGLAETSQEIEPWDTSDMAHRPGGLSVEQEPVAWVRDLTSPQPHCVTSMKYLSIADTDAGVKYIPVYAAPPKRKWVGLSDVEVAAYSDMFNGIRLMKAIEALLKRRNNG
jgi:hypothetical protein